MQTESADTLGAFGAARWPAPAKINRFLHITGRRSDGRHNIQTLFQFLGWGDELSFRVRRDGAIARYGDTEAIPTDDDLVVRAAQALRAATGAPYGVDIAVHKRIPMGSGLGGGSSDAATTLIALNTLWNCRLDAATLARIGLGLGADVPVFIHGHASWAEGVGEQLTSVAPDEPWILLALPGCAVSTAQAFAADALERDTAPVTMADFAAGRCRNVFEPVARALAPAVSETLDALAQAAAEAQADARPQLSGSGSACFLCLADRATARAAQRRMPAALPTLVTRAQNSSPLHVASLGPIGR